jgi:hypothetical protein
MRSFLRPPFAAAAGFAVLSGLAIGFAITRGDAVYWLAGAALVVGLVQMVVIPGSAGGEA